MRTRAGEAPREAMSLDDLPGAGNRDDAGFAREPVALPPPATGVSLWAFALARDATALRELEALLSPDERARAARFGTHSLRDRYVVGRGTLRRLLGATLGCAPGAVAIRRGLRGRPQVDGAGFDFNVTHTAGVALVGIAAHGRIGVDIEHRRSPSQR